MVVAQNHLCHAINQKRELETETTWIGCEIVKLKNDLEEVVDGLILRYRDLYLGFLFKVLAFWLRWCLA